MAHSTHYEVHVKQNGRWEIHARHSAADKELAIEEAKSLDTSKHIEAVKVIQEIYDPEDGTSKEYNVYAPGQKKYHPPRKTKLAAPESKVADSRGTSSSKTKAKPKSRESFTVLLLKILGITIFSSIVGSLFTWFVSMFIVDSTITDNAQTNILFLTFLVTFVMGAIPMAIVFLNKKP